MPLNKIFHSNPISGHKLPAPRLAKLIAGNGHDCGKQGEMRRSTRGDFLAAVALKDDRRPSAPGLLHSPSTSISALLDSRSCAERTWYTLRELATLTLGTPQVRELTSSRWIIGRGVDLTFVIGSSLAGYFYLFLILILQVPISYLWWFWSVGLDGTHIFGTASRTYFDREARQQGRRLLLGSLIVFFSIGPLMVLAGLQALLAVFVGTWAYYHVVRQHYGFVVLYKVKNGDLSPVDQRLDRLFLTVMLIAPPFHRFFIHHPEELGIPRRLALAAVPGVEPAVWTLVVLVGAAYLMRLGVRIRNREPLNLPKLLLLAGVVPLHWLTFALMSWKAAVPTVTIVHNLQYHALIWFHNRNKYGETGAGESRYGRIPKAAGSSLLSYALLAVVFSLLYRLPGFQIGRASEVAFGFFCGFGLTHYYLDSKIWRVRHDPSLRQTLCLEQRTNR
jgi:hypothetical protein